MRLPGFAGGSNVLSSDLVNCESSINLRPASAGPGTPKVDPWLQRTPGLRWLFTVGTDPVQALYALNSRSFGVSGTVFFEIFDDDTYISRGTVAASGSTNFPLATMCSNGSAGDQVFVTSGGQGYIFTLSTNAFAIIADADFPAGQALMGEFFGGYFFVLLLASRELRWSALEDGTAWDPLDVYQRSWAPDNISFIKRLGTHLWVVGQQTSEVLYATGGVEVFAPAQESLIEHGSVSPFSGVRLESETGALIWLDQSERGGGVVVVASGLQAKVVSTYAIAIFEQLEGHNLTKARCFAMQIDGHVEYVLNNAEVEYDRTPVYDVTEGLWHHRAHWDSAVAACKWIPWRPQCHMYFDQRHFVGDRLTGAVYELAQVNLTDQLADL